VTAGSHGEVRRLRTAGKQLEIARLKSRLGRGESIEEPSEEELDAELAELRAVFASRLVTRCPAYGTLHLLRGGAPGASEEPRPGRTPGAD
jgi:hypothetical protein